ncbi:MAG: CaiB/BaiF CoA transferase family protein [Gemmatimonadaceae bacterium]
MLSKTRVVDLSRILAGPLATMMLGDLGADVIKIERPGGGDETRGWGPPFDPGGQSAYFLSVNRNKLGLAADLDDPRDRELVAGLIATADVVVDNFRPDTFARRGLDPARLLADNPGLIWCTISGFGEHDPRLGYDAVIQGECGWMAVTGEAGGAPMKAGVAFADVIAGKDAAIAILAALVARGRAGRRGELDLTVRHLHISLSRSAVAALVNVAQNALVTGREPARWGNAHPNLVPYQLFEAADRPIVVAVGSDVQWKSCARALALDELGRDPELATNAGRLAHRERLVTALAARLGTRDATEWLALLGAAGVPCGVVRGVLEALAEVDSSPVTGVEPSAGGTVRLPPPRLDEHGADVRQLGWGAFPR